MAKKKGKLTKRQEETSARLAEELKGKPGVTDPFALANFLVQRKKKKKRNEDKLCLVQ